MKNITVLDGYTLSPLEGPLADISWSWLDGFGKVSWYPRTAPEDIILRIGNSEIVLTNKAVITKEVLNACPKLRYIGVLATGYNTVDVSAAKEKGVTVTYAPGYSTGAVAQLTFALLLQISFLVNEHNASAHKGEWADCPDSFYRKGPTFELKGKTMGIIGYGRIGKRAAELADAFGMKVLYYSRKNGNTDLQGLYKNSDIISLHAPLTAETALMINAKAIAEMKDGVIILNTSRGGLIHEKDLAEALNSGKVYALGTDVLSVEPPTGDNPLFSARNCVITPHIGWTPLEARSRLMEMTKTNLEAWVAGKPVNVAEVQ